MGHPQVDKRNQLSGPATNPRGAEASHRSPFRFLQIGISHRKKHPCQIWLFLIWNSYQSLLFITIPVIHFLTDLIVQYVLFTLDDWLMEIGQDGMRNSVRVHFSNNSYFSKMTNWQHKICHRIDLILSCVISIITNVTKFPFLDHLFHRHVVALPTKLNVTNINQLTNFRRLAQILEVLLFRLSTAVLRKSLKKFEQNLLGDFTPSSF